MLIENVRYSYFYFVFVVDFIEAKMYIIIMLFYYVVHVILSPAVFHWLNLAKLTYWWQYDNTINEISKILY